MSGTLRPEPRACLALGRLAKTFCHVLGIYDFVCTCEVLAYAHEAALYLDTILYGQISYEEIHIMHNESSTLYDECRFMEKSVDVSK